MLPDPQDTIVAVSSAPGPGARAIVRLSGPAAFQVAHKVFHPDNRIPAGRRLQEGEVRLSGLSAPLPADLYFWLAPRTYTGQDVAELHTLSCPPLVDVVVAGLLGAGARAAQAGEFTLRAFLAGKVDLPRAEAILGVIEAGTRDELREALGQMAGGVSQPLRALRADLLDLLADVEAGLDFAEEDISFIEQENLLKRLGKALAHVTLLRKQFAHRALGDRPFRVILVGPPNAGKSSLFNALTKAPAALVSAEAGTTRDYLVRRMDLDGVTIELVDTAGWRAPADTVEEQAQGLGREQVQQADLLLLCVDSEAPAHQAEGGVAVLQVRTKVDLVGNAPALEGHAKPQAAGVATSSVTGAGLDGLRAMLAERAWSHRRPALAPSLSRCRHHVESCLDHLRRTIKRPFSRNRPNCWHSNCAEHSISLGRWLERSIPMICLTGFSAASVLASRAGEAREGRRGVVPRLPKGRWTISGEAVCVSWRNAIHSTLVRGASFS